VVTPNAVAAMTDAFRSGAITAQDIIDRIGAVGQAKKKAELQSLQEFTNPATIEARRQAVLAANANAQLAQQQASAAGGLVQPTAALTAAQIAAQQQTLPLQTALTQQQLEMNARFMYPQAVLGIIQERMKPAGPPVSSVDPQTGTPFTRMFNSIGEDITPGSPTHSAYGKLAANVWSMAPGAAASTPPGVAPIPAPPGAVTQPIPPVVQPAPQATPPSAPTIQPPVTQSAPGAALDLGPDAAARAAQLNAGVPVPGLSDKLVTPNANATLPSPVEPAQAAPRATPTIEPNTGGYVPGRGIQTGMPKSYQTPAEIGTDLRKGDAYSLWDKQQAPANSFKTSAQEILNIPDADQRSGKAKMNALDLSLAENIIKMYDPGAAIREFKWDKLAEGQPYSEKLKNFQAEFFRTGTLTPESRKRLINLGLDTLAASDAAVKPHVQLAAQRAEQTGVPIATVLNPRELQILNGTNAGPQVSAPASGKLVTIPGLGTGTLDPATGIFTRTQ